MRLYIAGYGSQFACDDLVRNQWFAKRVPCVCVAKGFGETGTGFAVAAHGHDVAFLIEVAHDDGEAGVLGANQVGRRDAHVVELDKAGAAGFLPAVGDAAVR